jgi:hypothetical protein
MLTPSETLRKNDGLLGQTHCPAAVALPNTEWAAIDPADHLAAILFEKSPNQLWPARNFEA